MSENYRFWLEENKTPDESSQKKYGAEEIGGEERVGVQLREGEEAQ